MDTYLDDTSITGEEYDDPRCHGCSRPIDDGSVVQFGDGIWHFECFRCSKCHDLVECYSNLLLLRDGSPVCEKCSYCCHICHQVIKDEAIMTGEEAYHAECFRCIQCHTKIDDLVFTQTSKGIFCTQCHENRKQQRQRRKEEKLRQQQQQQQHHHRMDPTPLTLSDEDPSSMMTRQISTNSILNDYVVDAQQPDSAGNMLPTKRTSQQHQLPNDLSAFSDLSTQELIELNNMLNAAIEDGLIDNNMPSPPPETYRSPRSSSDSRTKPSQKSASELQQELDQTKSKLFQVETKLGQIKDISRRALDEYKNIKRRFDVEMTARQDAQTKVDKLQNELSFCHHLSLFGPAGFMQYSRDELAQLHRVKVQVDQSVNDLRKQRDLILTDIERNKTVQWDRFTTAQQQHLISLQHDTDHARLGYDRLVKARDDIITEMIMLNTKNAELSNLNNDLSRRMTEREREAMAVMAGTSFLAGDTQLPATTATTTTTTNEQPPAGRRSLEHQLKNLVSPKLTAHRDSFNDVITPPRRFRFRRNRSKRSGSTGQHSNSSGDKKDGDLLIGMPYSDSTPSDGSHKVLMFGNDLVKQVQSEHQPIPLVVRKCIEAVEQRGMDCEGVYRKSGGATQMRSIQLAFENKENIDLCDEDQWNDICAVTSVLKQYFRDLPNPLFTFEYHQKWVDALLSKEAKIDAFQKLLHCIPVEHFNTLKYLMQHLAKIDSRNSENLMTAKNLAVVFGPTLMRHTDENLDLIEMNHKIGCIEFILTHMDEIFAGPVPDTTNRSAPLPVRKNSLPTRHRREASIGLPAPAVPPRENAGFI